MAKQKNKPETIINLPVLQRQGRVFGLSNAFEALERKRRSRQCKTIIKRNQTQRGL
ncbi:MAG: hypothetical protein LBT45_01200 [Rickettsiales bacterium]|jgi:hypothetical protein|nr:hypothetical protein [Rickettsiales bacterium]